MDLRNTLTSLKENIMAKIQLAASHQHTHEIILLGTFAKQVDSDLATLSEIEEHTRALKDQLDVLNLSKDTEAVINAPLGIKVLPRSPSTEVTTLSSRKQGLDAARIAREEFIQTCNNRGIRLLPRRKTIVSTSSGALIALPFARELPDTLDRWFLGVNEGSIPAICPYACVAFLCQDADGRVLTFLVPQKRLQQHWNQFSRHSSNVKFNIRKDGVNFKLDVPGNDPVRLNTYQEAYDNLKGV
jgi:hypothetical protein